MIAPHLLGLRALVSGVPEPRRSGSLLFMLQVLCDETESHTEPRMFIVGGYIATVERWEGLTNAWQEVLNLPPRLSYFSFHEAFPDGGPPRRQFYGMTPEQRDQRVALLRSIIEHYALAEIGVGFKLAPYKAAFAGLDKMANNPYFFAVQALDKVVARNMEKIGLPRQPLQFIYDDKKKEEPYLLDAWFWARSRANPDPPDLFDVLTTAPQFRPSKGPDGVIALQAADLFVGWTRACNTAEMRGGSAMRLPGYNRELPGIFWPCTDQELIDAAERIRRRNAESAQQ
jgi:hypothetical protein